MNESKTAFQFMLHQKMQGAENHIKHLFLSFLITALISCCFISDSLISVMAKEPNHGSRQKYYTSIQIKKGDSLWTIAETYNINTGKTTKDYVKELKFMNSLGEDTIHSGKYLIVYYYKE